MKTLFLAASLFCGLAYAQAPGQLQKAEDVLWTRLRPSVAQIMGKGVEPGGVAVLIDKRGWFLAHGSAISGNESGGRIGTTVYLFRVIARDKETNLALLHAPMWEPGTGTPIAVSPAASQSGERILAITVDGPVWAELGRKDRIGNMQPSQRYAPLNELRLETGKARVHGALAFNERGELVGVLGATLTDPEAGRGGKPTQGSTSNTGAAGGGGAGGGGGNGVTTFGPGELTVAYAFGPKLLERVVEGFRRPDHVVRHPSIGVFFKKSPDGGALIEAVVPGGEAEKGGLQPGDVVINADGTPITDAVGFATVLFNQNIGDVFKVQFRRGDKVQEVDIKVGIQPMSEMTASSSFQRIDLSPRNSLNSGRNARSRTEPILKS